MSNGVEIGNTVAVMNPKALLTGVLKAGVVTLAFGPESVSSLKGKTGAVNGKTVVIGNSDILGAAAVFLAIVPVLEPAPDSDSGLRCGSAQLRSDSHRPWAGWSRRGQTSRSAPC